MVKPTHGCADLQVRIFGEDWPQVLDIEARSLTSKQFFK